MELLGGLTEAQASMQIERLKQEERGLDVAIAREKVQQKRYLLEAEKTRTQKASLEPRIAAFELQAKQIDLQTASLLPQRAQEKLNKERIELNRDRLKTGVAQIQLQAEATKASILNSKLQNEIEEQRIDLQSAQKKLANKRSLLSFKGEL